jgi:hypothetical protein
MESRMDTLNLGTKELISVYLSDKLGLIDTIPAADFKVISEDEVDTVANWAAVENIDGMRVDCLIDTTTGAGITNTDPWPEGTYKLYVRPNIPPETPIVGPWEFGVS